MRLEKVQDDERLKDEQPEPPGVIGGLAQRLQDGVRATLVALGQSHSQRLAAIIESSEDAIFSQDLSGIIATWNEGAEKLFGYAAQEIVGRSVSIIIPAERQREELDILLRIKRGQRLPQFETARLRKSGKSVDISLAVSPIVHANGTVVGLSKIARDITERKRIERYQDAMHEFTDKLFRAISVEDVYQAALDAIVRALGCDRASILLFDHAGIMKFVAWRGLSDTYRQAVEGHSPWTRETREPHPICIEDIDVAELDTGLKATVKAEGIAALAFIPLLAQGQLIGKFMAYYPRPHAFGSVELEVALTVARQLGFSVERMRAEESKQLLLNEAKHRIKNVLATVQAIARQTLKPAGPTEINTFLARLQALSTAHDLLSTEDWDQALLGEVVGRALQPFQPTGQNRVNIEGPRLAVPAQTALILTMCLHELATNATKYGALSNDSGKIDVAWQSVGSGNKVKLFWRESGGPPVVAPVRKGFGSLLIKQSFGGADFDFASEGLSCSLELQVS